MFRGCVIPFRPGKTSVNSTAMRGHKDTFLRDRAYAIKCYLNKVTHHPEIKQSTVRTPEFAFMRSAHVQSQYHQHTQPITCATPHAVNLALASVCSACRAGVYLNIQDPCVVWRPNVQN
jgi:hypothetical protein